MPPNISVKNMLINAYIIFLLKSFLINYDPSHVSIYAVRKGCVCFFLINKAI